MFAMWKESRNIFVAEIKVVVQSQNAYMLELEKSLLKKDKEHEAWAAKIHGQIKHFMTDALEAITVRNKFLLYLQTH